MTFGEIKNSVKVLTSQVTTATVEEAINQAYEEILSLRNWWFLRKSCCISTVAEKSGSVFLEKGSDQISINIPLSSSDLGSYLYVSSYTPLRIISIISDQSAKLMHIWPYTSGTYDCVIRKSRYSIPADARRVLSVRYENLNLQKVPARYIDVVDPVRKQTGTPECFAETEIYNGNREIELWPVPTVEILYDVVYMLKPKRLEEDDDEPIIPGEIIRVAAMSRIAALMFSYTGDLTWQTTASNYAEQTRELLRSLIQEDQRIRGAADTVLGPYDMVDINNPYAIKSIRIWNAITGIYR